MEKVLSKAIFGENDIFVFGGFPHLGVGPKGAFGTSFYPCQKLDFARLPGT
jgi:hypothetical protein